MGIQLSVSTIKMMKSIFFACLVAAVYAEAEPKAEADAFYNYGYIGYNGLVSGYTGYALPAYRSYAAPAYRTYAAPAYTTGYANYGYAGLNAGHYIAKREAEAEPEAEADAFYGYSGYHGYSGLYNGYSSYRPAVYTTSYARPVYSSYGYSRPAVYGGYHHAGYYGKRSAEAEPEAEAYYGSYGYSAYSPVYSGYTSYSRPVYSGYGYSRLGYGYHY